MQWYSAGNLCWEPFGWWSYGLLSSYPCILQFEYCTGGCLKFLFIGIVAALTPFGFPLFLTLHYVLINTLVASDNCTAAISCDDHTCSQDNSPQSCVSCDPATLVYCVSFSWGYWKGCRVGIGGHCWAWLGCAGKIDISPWWFLIYLFEYYIFPNSILVSL